MHLLSLHHIHLSLKCRWRAALFLFLAATISLAGSAEAVKIAAVTALEDSADVSRIRTALAWDPANAALHDCLSQLDADLTGRTNIAVALAEARRATALAPARSDYWLTLASTCETAGDRACADHAFARALALSPMAPGLWWAAGNHFLRAGRPQSALACFRRLLELSPDDYAPQVFDLTLRAYDDPKLILQSVVAAESDSRAALAFADFMSAQGQFEAARQAWDQIAARGAAFPFAAVEPYLERSLAAQRYQDAQDVWVGLEARGVVRQPPEDEPGNLVFNGGFEQTPLAAGFDWRAQPAGYASVDFTDASAYAGERCLRVDFPVSQNDDFDPVDQIVPVTPGRTYAFEAQVRTQDITSDSGPRLRITDAACPACLDVSTDASVGTTAWHKVAVRFAASPQTEAVRISVWRPPSRAFPMEITGTFWLDAVSLRAEPQ